MSSTQNPTSDREMADKNTLLCGMNAFQILAGREKHASVDIGKAKSIGFDALHASKKDTTLHQVFMICL